MATYTLTGTAKNELGLESPFTGTLTVLENMPPVINSVTQAPNPVRRGQTVRITVSATDPQGSPLTYTLKIGDVNIPQVEGMPGVFDYLVPLV